MGARSLNSQLINFNGQTTDDKIVISGESIFRYMDTKGLPLDFILMSIDKEKYIIDWMEFMEISIKCKWKVKSTLLKLEQGFIDYYDKEFSNVIIQRLKDYYER